MFVGVGFVAVMLDPDRMPGISRDRKQSVAGFVSPQPAIESHKPREHLFDQFPIGRKRGNTGNDRE